MALSRKKIICQRTYGLRLKLDRSENENPRTPWEGARKRHTKKKTNHQQS
jgi:hypothetical protein